VFPQWRRLGEVLRVVLIVRHGGQSLKRRRVGSDGAVVCAAGQLRRIRLWRGLVGWILRHLRDAITVHHGRRGVQKNSWGFQYVAQGHEARRPAIARRSGCLL
jgi:hypothetical protein